MKRKLWTVLVLAVLSVGFLGTVSAQDSRVQFNVGADFPLVSRTFEVEQSLAYQASLAFKARDRFWLGLIYETQSTEDDLGSMQDVDLSLYGVTGIFTLSGDRGFQLIAIASVGTGELEWSNELGAGDDGLPDDTDIDLWYELGLGAEFRSGDHFVFRVTGTIRRLHPKSPSDLLQESRTALVPAVTIGYAF